MKFTTTYNVTNRYPIGDVPKPWIDYGKDHMDSIRHYFYREIKLYDWDVCGEETHDFLFEDGKAFRLEYSWWSEWYHDDDEENGLKDEYYIEEIDPETAKLPSKMERDWL